jgi:hypothetical protein
VNQSRTKRTLRSLAISMTSLADFGWSAMVAVFSLLRWRVRQRRRRRKI